MVCDLAIDRLAGMNGYDNNAKTRRRKDAKEEEKGDMSTSLSLLSSFASLRPRDFAFSLCMKNHEALFSTALTD